MVGVAIVSSQIESIQWYRYEARLVEPVSVPGQNLTSRTAFIVKMTSVEGKTGWGEASPLPGFHGWKDERAISEEIRDISSLLRETDDVKIAMSSRALSPAIAFGLSSALAWIDLKKNDVRTRFALDLTRLIPGGSVIDAPEIVGSSNSQIVKVKVGGDIQTDAARVSQVIRAFGGGVRIRLDANRRWTFAQAVDFANRVDVRLIDFIEEPFPAWERFREFSEGLSIRVACDESLQEAVGDARLSQEVIAASDVLVVKPTMIGSIDDCVELSRIAGANEKGFVLSSAYETGIGMLGILQTALRVGDSQSAAGLGTYRFIGEDILETRLPLEGGSIRLDNVFSGVKVREDKLTRIEG